MKNYFIALATVMMLNACQSGTTEQTTTTATPTEQATSGGGQSAVADDVSAKDVVKVAVGSPDHTTLVAAVKAGELVDALSNAGPFTVFAPTNAAFDQLPKGTVEDLLKPENKSKLQDILQYHVSVGVFNADQFQDGQNIGQVNGGNITMHVKDGKVMVNDANVVATVKASNGVVHVIDKVLLPK